MKTRTIASLLLMTLFCITLPVVKSSAPAEKKEPHWLIVGGTRDTGYALAQEVVARGLACTLFVRPGSEKQISSLFSPAVAQALTVVTGDVVTEREKVVKAATIATVVYFAQTFPYKIWADAVTPAVENCLAAARSANALFVYPGRIYPYGAPTDEQKSLCITETTVQNPTCVHGTVMQKVETLIEKEATSKKTRACIIRSSFPFGPAFKDKLIGESFKTLVKPEKNWLGQEKPYSFFWLGNKTDIPTQLIYTPDLARLSLDYVAYLQTTDKQFDMVNVAGYALNGISTFAHEVCTAGNKPYSLTCHSKAKVTAGAFLDKEIKRAEDVFYSFTKSIMLAEDKLHETLGTVVYTPLQQAIADTIQWYIDHA